MGSAPFIRRTRAAIRRRRVLADAGADAATLDLLSVLGRAGPPYQLTTRQLTEQTRVTAGAISQRVVVTLLPAGHALVERLVDRVLGREADLVSSLSAADQAALTGLLKALLDDLSVRLGPQRHSQVGASWRAA
jgi:hypothetical protein